LDSFWADCLFFLIMRNPRIIFTQLEWLHVLPVMVGYLPAILVIQILNVAHAVNAGDAERQVGSKSKGH
jgi:hypothetical protein